MNQPLTRRKMAIGRVSLLIVAALITGIWRWEVELRGPEGWTWISYFHWAIPIGAGLFALWLAILSNLPTLRKRLLLAGLFLLGFYPLFVVMANALYLSFVGGPSAFALAATIGFRLFGLLHITSLLIYPGILALFWGVAGFQGLRLDWRLYLQSAIAYLPAWKWAVMVAPLTRTIPDNLHALKSGNLFFFMVVGLGLPFLAPYRETESRYSKVWRFLRRKVHRDAPSKETKVSDR